MYPELENIPPDMSLVELVKRTQVNLNTLNHLLKKNPNLRVADILMPDPNSPQAEVRRVMFDIFHRAAEAMARNSEAAGIASMKAWILFNAELFDEYNGKPELFLKEQILPNLDPDLARYLHHVEVYYHPNSPKIFALYRTLGNMRWRNRSRK